LAAATAVSTLGGCEQLEKKAPEDTVAVSFGDTNIMLDEVTYMIRSMEYTYESYFGSNICGNDMGDGSGMTVGDYIKQMSLSQLRQTLVLNEYAKKNGIELSDDQKAKVDEAIEKLQTESEDYLDAVGATDELIEKTYTENAIANLVYMDLVADVDTTVGDDEFLRKKIAYVKLTPSELTETTAADEATTEVSSDEDSSEEAYSIENTEVESESASKDVTTSTEEASSEKASTEAVSTGEASSENVSKLSSEASTEDSTEVETLSEEEQERQDAMNDAADKILKEFEEGNDAADFISDYQNDSHFTATNSEISISEDGTAVYNASAWALATDECTVYRSDDGSIYIIRCLDDNDEEARQSAIDSEIESRKTELFSEKYAEIQDDSSKFKVDEDVIDTIRFTTPVYVAPSEEETSESETSGEETSESETGEEESTKEEKSSESDESEEAVSEASSEEESK
ncbi:MAG: hypothetical protein SO186_01785, partial [Lachnospiraceae bacterium]|nr:hypothetical protein [Lachnospiraceae bacterium]